MRFSADPFYLPGIDARPIFIDDLSPLYVYESKMSLFIRMAQTRLGAERLLEAQLIPTLAQCDYIDSMPESDQAFMGQLCTLSRLLNQEANENLTDNDSFLPSAIARYHQLLTPAIQVIDGILAILGNKHSTATSQVRRLSCLAPPNLRLTLRTNRHWNSSITTARQSLSC